MVMAPFGYGTMWLWSAVLGSHLCDIILFFAAYFFTHLRDMILFLSLLLRACKRTSELRARARMHARVRAHVYI